jgi:hypothetical protein
MNALAVALQIGELTPRDIIADIPRDIGAVFVFLIVGGMTFLIWYGSRRDVIERYGAGRIRPSPKPSTKTSVDVPDPS